MKKYGLTKEQVEESRAKFGSNELTKQKTEGFWRKLWGNFGDPMIRILCVALIINVVFAILGQVEWYESVGIAAAVLLATLVSTFSEYKNENAFQKLQEEASQIKCKVYRDGDIVEIPIGELVVGDCVLLQAGDKIPADGILLDGSVQVDQSVLNGEAKEASKGVMPHDYVDEDASVDFLNPYKVFRGSVVCVGNAVMQISTVGDKTVYGQIASELQVEDDRETPLKLKLGKLAKQISMFGYIGGIAIALAFLFQRIFIHNGFDFAVIGEYFSNWMNPVNDLVEAVMLSVIIIVMAVPEGLPLMIAIVSAQNMGKMLKDNVLVRKVSGIETAGSLNILFSDKTGTITKGQLEAVTFVDGQGNEYKSFDDVVGELGNLLSLSVRHNTNALLTGEGTNIHIVGGNATERAILGFVSGRAETANVTVTGSIPFNSQNKYSAAMVEGDYAISLVKGAPEKILSRCTTYYDSEGNKKPLAASADAVNAKIDALAARAIRVLALATCDKKFEGDALPDGAWTLVGIIGIRDEVRPESIVSIKKVKAAGVQVVMITGDRKDTATAIAKEAGLIDSDDNIVLTSDELAGLSDEQLPRIRVVARALPSDKSRFVKIAQELNLVVGMTGDGVNDSPALKKADVGFAMGGGTEVAKEASEIVILDDNFNSIQKAILYGRTIFNNIRKFIVFQLTINVAAVLISFICPLLSIENPLSITQILWVNLVMDTLAALAFGGEPALEKYMQAKPKRRDEAIVSPSMWGSILVGSLWTFALSLIFILTPAIRDCFRAADDDIYHMTGYFAFFILTAVFNAFNARTEEFNLFKDITKNKRFLQMLGLITVVQVLLTYFGGVIFRCHGLNLVEWAIVLGFSISIIPVDLFRKFIVKLIRDGRRKPSVGAQASKG